MLNLAGLADFIVRNENSAQMKMPALRSSMNKKPKSTQQNPGNVDSPHEIRPRGFSMTLAITFGILQLIWLAWLGYVAWKVLAG
ncbi:hypothetical protein MFFC18_19760 [Mariniblastus fucicola]|uniref:Uncharacterized protein n=2 Tax=Mariniblastus fucicola TaxID=980251 RepID=A0A5B9PA62_9BACT|nr:hypothetical protein MFFC18_19760 [Mariniblastus fucicola]